MIINFEDDVGRLRKDELGLALNFNDKEIRTYKKAELISMFLYKFNNELSKRKF